MNRLFVMCVMLFSFAATAQTLAPMNNYQAYAVSVQAAHQAVSDKCESKTGALKAMAAKCASDICLALFADKVSNACDGGQGSGQVAVAQPPAAERSAWEIATETVLSVARVALPFVDRVMSSKERRESLQSSERTTIAQYGMFKDINGQTAALGGKGFDSLTNLGTAGFNSLERTATAGFGSLERTAVSGYGSLERGMIAGLNKPTYDITVNGNDNALFGSTSSRTYAINCTSGNGGNGGNSAPGGSGGNTSTAGTAGAGGYNAAGYGAPSGSVPCAISK